MSAYQTTWAEDRVLAYFWMAARDEEVDRIDLLKQIANVAVQRPDDWDTRLIRQEADFTVTAEQCFSCRSGEHKLYWHHVILVKHGGSNDPRNLVCICHACHRRVHPWLPEGNSAENKYGWTLIGDLGAKMVRRLERILTTGQRKQADR